ncbi:unnamed protein product [Symbiodinium sp. CCMP2456]|nr:unnamed protein product [Symbiodinium sp. CCMP2456]
MADDAGATSRTEESGLEADDDLFEYLEIKRKEVAAMTQAAEIAREQAGCFANFGLKRFQEVGALNGQWMAGSRAWLKAQASSKSVDPAASLLGSQAGHVGDDGEGAQAFDGGPVHASTLSFEDRRRFGLEVTPPPSEAIPTPPPSASEVQAGASVSSQIAS